MSREEKLFKKAFNNSNGLSYDEFIILLKRLGWRYDRQKGSHQIWYSLNRKLLIIQNLKGKAKGYQVKPFIEQYRRL